MREELAGGNVGSISSRLAGEIERNLAAKKQTILLLNRRGYRTVGMCTGCGEVIKCGGCSVPMVYHKSENRLLCHYCGASISPVPETCPSVSYTHLDVYKRQVKIPIDIHSHYTSGLASMSMLKGIEAGADICDTVISPLALGTSHMPTESLVAALQGTEYDTGLDLKKLDVVRAHFAKLREKYLASGQLNPKMLGVDANTLLYQVPGGMLSNLLKQLKDAGKEDKLEEVLRAVPRVREDSGYPPLVTPTSQIVGTQAVFNVILGERYKMVTKEFKGLVHGDYGKTPAPISPEFTKKTVSYTHLADAVPRPEHAGLPSVCRRRGRVLCAEVRCERHQHPAYFRRAE